MTRHVPCVNPAERGFVLVAVLWILMALSALAAVFSVYLSGSARALAVNDVALRTEALVSAGVELTAYQLALAGDKRPSHGSFQFRMDDAEVRVLYTSEAARIDLNFAPKDVLTALFAELGAAKGTASEDADRIVGWRTRPVPGATNDEEALYAAAGLDYAPRQALFTHVNELALVAGLPPALVERALPFVTVFNGSSAVDATIAAPEVIAALPDDAPGKRQPLSGDGPAPPGGVATDTLAANGGAPAAKSPCYRVAATIRYQDGRRTTSEVVVALGDKVEPYRVLSWQDDMEPHDGGARQRGGR